MTEAYLAGRGLACALGVGVSSALEGLRAGHVAAGRLSLVDGSEWPFLQIPDDESDWTTRTRKLVECAAAESGALAGPRTGPLLLASSSLDIGWLEDTLAFPDAYTAFANTVAGWLHWLGPVHTVSTACTSGLNALLAARSLIRSGHIADALVLGVELRNRVTVGGFGGMQLLSADRARPYGVGRNGLVLGEAVAALHVSSGASRWRVAGGANVVDGRDPAGTLAEAVVSMCRQALNDAGIAAHEVSLIKPQAAGGHASDATEALALRQVFDPLPPLVSFKAAIGHTLGAAGVAEIALLTACLEDTGPNRAWPRVDWPLDELLNAPLAPHAPASARHVLASILGFGGGHAAVVLEDQMHGDH